MCVHLSLCGGVNFYRIQTDENQRSKTARPGDMHMVF